MTMDESGIDWSDITYEYHQDADGDIIAVKRWGTGRHRQTTPKKFEFSAKRLGTPCGKSETYLTFKEVDP